MKLKKVNQFPHEIMLEDGDRCISIYMPTNRKTSNWKQDRIRLKNLVSEVETALLKDMKAQEVKEMLEPLEEILENPYFWNTVEESLAILLNSKEGIYYNMNRDVEEYVLVSDEFYIKPLVRNFQSYDKYHVLGLSKEEFKLYEGTRYSFDEIVLDERILTRKEDIIDEEERKSKMDFRFKNRSSGSKSFYGNDTKSEGVEIETELFFRHVDKAVLDYFGSDKDIPLILLSLSENQGVFRNISKNINLLDEGVDRSLVSIDENVLRDEIWEVIEPMYLNKTKELIDRFKEAQGESLGSRDLLEIAYGCTQGKVDTLIVESDRVINSYYDEEEGKLIDVDEDHIKTDLINQLVILTLKQDGEVIVLPKERFPEDSGCVAIFRY